MAARPVVHTEKRVADAELVYGAVMTEVDSCVWSSTGGTDGCVKCRDKAFRARIAVGHLDCAREGVAAAAAAELRDHLTRGGLFATLMRTLPDPRLSFYSGEAG